MGFILECGRRDYSGGVSHSESLCPLCASDMAPFAAHPFMLPPLPSVFPLIAHTLPSVILSRPITLAMATREVETQPQTGTIPPFLQVPPFRPPSQQRTSKWPRPVKCCPWPGACPASRDPGIRNLRWASTRSRKYRSTGL